MEPIISIEHIFVRLPAVSVVVEDYVPPRIPNPTEAELATVPARFRCVICRRNKEKKWFGGYVAGERVCRICFSIIDEHDILALQPISHRPATRRDRNHPPLVKDVWSGITAEMLAEAEYIEINIIAKL